ncbi:MAG: hypothetical protein P1U42_10205 [Phycisphaerales bacterium]|nr:hypothetical protein [Phycisphaerales bacterium]
MHTNTKNHARRTAMFVSPLALVLASGLVGCETSSTLTRTDNSQFSPSAQAEHATISLDSSITQGDFTSASYIDEGDSFALPQEWVSEAREGTASIEAQRANAQSFEIYSDSNYTESMAKADADLQDGFVTRDTGYADAQRTETIHNARLMQMDRQMAARAYETESKTQRQEAFLVASVKEWQSEIERMRSESEKEWSTSLAENDRMMATYAAVRDRGQAEIAQMVQISDHTEERAIKKVQELRAQAQAVAEQANAEVSSLSQQVNTVSEQTTAEYSELLQRARSLDSTFSSEIATLNAKANEFESADAAENYQMMVESAQTSYETSLAEAENIRLNADEQSMRDHAQVARLSADANAKLSSSQTTFEEAQQWVSSQYTKSMADIQNTLAQADREEQVARSNFIKAETDARVKAMQQQAEHDRALAADELEKIEAESIAEARLLSAKFAKEFAVQARKGSFVIPSNDKTENNTISNDQNTPELTKADAKPVNVEADRIASFKIGLAKASKLRQEADANRLDAIAHRDSEIGKFNNWWSAKQADFNATMASIESYGLKSNADVNRMLTKSDSMIATAETERNRALVGAESSRTEALATIETLRGNSSTLNKKKEAQVKQIFAQAEATKRIGESKVASLKVQRDAAGRRGEAKSAQLLAEASSLELSQRAVVAQMRKEVDASRQILDAELARLNQATDSFIAIAEANYNEGIAMADAFERIAIANTSELTARHIASKKQSDADLEYMQHLANAGEMMRDAEVTRLFAQADESLGMQQAHDIALRGEIEANQQIAMASAAREFAVADARESGVRARFDHRVAATNADRNRAYADLYAQAHEQLARTEMAAAQAETYSELSQAALARLSTAAQSFQVTAQRNWDSRLAMPTQFSTPSDVESLFKSSTETFDFDAFATVPTDSE